MGLIDLATDRLDDATGWLEATWLELQNRGFRHPCFAYARGDIPRHSPESVGPPTLTR
jgi:hypothetical protein